MTLFEEFCRHLETFRFEGGSALVAVSGGPDSLALLDLLARSRDRHHLVLVVAHVDHGIHPDSERVADTIRAVAERYDFPFELGHLRLGPSAGETLARTARYAWLERARRRVGAGLIFTAHHADDQVETVLMRVLRGSGPAGLAGMAARRGAVVRPLLPFRRAALEAYLAEIGLVPWIDPANADPRHLRSWLRTELLPVLRARLPDVDADVARLASQAGRDREAWDAALDRMPGLDVRREEEDGVSCAMAGLGAADTPLAQALLIAAARRVGCQVGPARLARVTALLAAGESGTAVPLGGGWRAELSFGRLHILSDREAETGGHHEPWLIQGAEGERWWGRWRFRWRLDPAPPPPERQGFSAWFPPPAEPLLVRSWQPGERIRPLAGTGRRPVTRCLQEARVPRWRRTGWPVVTADEAVVWVPGICRSDTLLPLSTAPALRLDAEYI
jgi:tRNA(Ile)-lysidine synthase